MRILVVGAGGVGGAVAGIAARRDFFERMVVADDAADRARAAVDRLGDPRITAARVDASDAAGIARLGYASRTRRAERQAATSRDMP
ncbi:MAG TPA: saccharopine dehydrogenase NADP-binding domain-containing protein [Streptosporangiaceae bacterium]|nr:saccharopine dehydrogenase NADP-binding domain-containing protein [Streptosporangiaceae bacterium]